MRTRTPSRSSGHSLLEATLVLGLAGLLATLGFGALDTRSQDLTVAQQELRGTLDQAFHLARARGSQVTVGIRLPAGPDVLPVHVSPRLRWGKPAHIPLPPGMDDPVRADQDGEAHRSIVVTPLHTATAAAWFLHDGRDVLCMRLSGQGRVQMLRWRAGSRRWMRV